MSGSCVRELCGGVVLRTCIRKLCGSVVWGSCVGKLCRGAVLEICVRVALGSCDGGVMSDNKV